MNDKDKQQLVSSDLAVDNTKSYAPLHECVTHALDDYFKHLNGYSTTNLYEMLITEVEAPLFKATLDYTKGNQSRAAEILGINRGTLRKKLKQYDL